MQVEPQGLGNYKIVGALKGDFASISVVWQYDGKGDEPYTLQKYIPANRVFEYYIQPRFHTIAKGDNTYIFTGHRADGTEESTGVTITETNDINVSGKNCLLDICIDDSQPSTMSGTAILQKTQSGTDEDGISTDITVDPTKGAASMIETGFMYVTSTFVTKYDSFFVRGSQTQSCGPSSWKQEIYDASGQNIIHNASVDVPKELTIGTQTFTLDDLNADISTYMYGTLQENKEIEKVYSKNDTDIEDDLLAGIKKEKDMPKKFVLSFVEYPNIKFVYSMKEDQPERVIYLGTDPSYISANVSANGNLLDKDVTNTILSYYTGARLFVPTKSKIGYNNGVMTGNITTVSNNNPAPLFRVEKLTDDGYYLLYPHDGYAFQSFAELCKPVVYLYTQEPRDLAVTVDLYGQGFFTHLIPTFSTGTTWYTHTTGSGVRVGGTDYGYLYYSAMVTGFTFNTNGWIIRGDEALVFFADKLPKIGFKPSEEKDFIDYWKGEFKPHSYYFVSFKYNEQVDALVSLLLSQTPESRERVLMESYELPLLAPDQEQYLYDTVGSRFDPYLLRTFERSGDFDMFEWGGVLMDSDKITIR